jgi:hypothetical protein
MLGGAAGCDENPVAPSPLGQPFDLRAGATATVGSHLSVTFLRVNSDSRCPMDALCVWAGEAAITIVLAEPPGTPTIGEGGCKGGSNRAECVLVTTPGGSTASHGTHTIRLVQLAPYPSSATPIRGEDYVATLTVSSP